MLHLLQLEWKKLASNRLFLVTSGLYILLLPLLYKSVQSSSNASDPDNPMASIYRSLYEFPNLWDTITYLSSWLTFFLMTYLVLFSITSEYNNRTLRQNLITGMSRKEWLTSKVLLIIALTLIAVVYTFCVGLVIGFIAGGYGKPFTSHLVALGYFGLQSIFYGVSALFLAVVFRRGGLALMVFFAYMLIIERIIRYLIFGNLFDQLAWGSYLPASVAWDAVPFFMVKRVPGVLEGNVEGVLLSPGLATVIMLGYTLLFLVLTYRIFNRRDL